MTLNATPPAALKSLVQVAIQGELGSNSHLAVLQVFAGESVEIVARPTSADVFEALELGTAQVAVLPIENSLHGSVADHFDLLLDRPVVLVGETLLRIQHNVIAVPGVRLDQLRRVRSHPVALSQCRRWLRAHSDIQSEPHYDTAGSVRQMMQEQARDWAGIAPALAARHYGAQILAEAIEDHPDNFTRFYVIESTGAEVMERPLASPANKLSVAFSLEHQPGTLIRALSVFEQAGLNLTKIESRPVPGRPWEYVFFVDLRFEQTDVLEQALARLRDQCHLFKELGRYRSALQS